MLLMKSGTDRPGTILRRLSNTSMHVSNRKSLQLALRTTEEWRKPTATRWKFAVWRVKLGKERRQRYRKDGTSTWDLPTRKPLRTTQNWTLMRPSLVVTTI